MELTNTQLAKLKNYFEGNPIYEGGLFNLYPPADVQASFKELGHSDLLPGEMYPPFTNIMSYDEIPSFIDSESERDTHGFTVPGVDQRVYIAGIKNYGSGYGPTHEAKTLHPAIYDLYHTPGKIDALKKSGVDTANLVKSFFKHNPEETLWSGPSQTEMDADIAATIGHENYHQILANHPLYAALFEKMGGTTGTEQEEAFIRALEVHLNKTERQKREAKGWFDRNRPDRIVSPHIPRPVNRYLENIKPDVDKFIEIANLRNRHGTPIVPMDRGRERADRPSPSVSRDRGRSRSRGETGRIAGGHHFNYGGIVSVL